MTTQNYTATELYFDRKHAFELLAWTNHPEPVALLEAAHDVALEAIEAHDWGQFPENLQLTVTNFERKFQTMSGLRAYKYALQVRDTYERC